MTMAVAAGIYVVAIVLVLWAGSRRIGSRWAYLFGSDVFLIAGAFAIILSPSSQHTGLEPRGGGSPRSAPAEAGSVEGSSCSVSPPWRPR